MRIPKPRLLRAVMNPDSQYENYMSNKGPISAASEVLREGAAQVWGRGSSGTLRARVLSGSMIMLVSSGLVRGGISLLLLLTSPILSNYLNLPTRNYIVLLAAGIVFFVPLGVRRGLMQGMYDFPHLAGNFVLEVIVKLGGALLLIRFGLGVTGVIAAVVASIVPYC